MRSYIQGWPQTHIAIFFISHKSVWSAKQVSVMWKIVTGNFQEIFVKQFKAQWLYISNEHHNFSNHLQLDCLFNFLSTKRSSKFCITGPLLGESIRDQWIQSTSNIERFSWSWHHHETNNFQSSHYWEIVHDGKFTRKSSHHLSPEWATCCPINSLV